MPIETEALIVQAKALGASDIHLVKGQPPRFRINGELRSYGAILSAADCEYHARKLAGSAYQKIEKQGELDLAITVGGNVRCRVNLFRQRGFVSAAIRLLNEQIPSLSLLGLPPAAEKLPMLKRGIVLVTGETGSGKSTTLAAMLDSINHSKFKHIITLEDPIEYIYTPDKCLINQREIGKDTVNYAAGLRAALREDPDVLLIGEMRDLETIETALTAAETGHLVFATLHTNSAADSIDRIVDVFPEMRQKQIRLQLSTTLMAVLSQQLVLAKAGGRALACELMMVTPAIRNLIREGKTPQIAGSLATSAADGSVTMDNSLIALWRKQAIVAETARSAAHDVEYVRKNTL